MENEFGFKDLYYVSIKATYPIEVGKRTIEAGEVLAFFDKIQIANFKEIQSLKAARGGFDNRAWVWWEETKEIPFSFSQGVFSKTQFALMTNAKIVAPKPAQNIFISAREILETDEDGRVYLKNEPDFSQKIFIYNKKTGERINEYSYDGTEKALLIGESYLEIVIDYSYQYGGNTQIISFGNGLLGGYLTLTGKTRVKDDTTGQVKTGIFTIPKFKLVSDLSMTLGSGSAPILGTIDAIAIPVGAKGQKKIMDLLLLDDDIDSDI